MMDSSTKIIATSDWQGHIEKYFSDYSRKIYISEIPSLKPIDEISTGKFADNKIHFVYAGSLNHNMRSPKYTLELFHYVWKKILIMFYICILLGIARG